MVNIEIDEEAVTINGTRLDAPPTVQQLSDLLSLQPGPARTDATGPSGWLNWTWDDLGIMAEGWVDTDVRGLTVWHQCQTVARAPRSPFQGIIKLFGVDAFETDTTTRLADRLTELDTDIKLNGKALGMGGKIRLKAPEIHLFTNNRISFLWPTAPATFPADIAPNANERVLAKLEGYSDLECILSNQRLIARLPQTPAWQWSLNDIKSFNLRGNIDSLADVPGAIKVWENEPWIFRLLKAASYKPPFDVVEIDTSSEGKVSIVLARWDNDVPTRFDGRSYFEHFKDCVDSAISRYRGRVSGAFPKVVPNTTPSVHEAIPPVVNDGLVPCPRCSSRVSPKAVHCPVCGQPISGGLFRVDRGTRERTPKFVKIARPLSWLMMIVFGCGLLADILLYGGPNFAVWTLGLVVSIGLLVYLRIGQWWHQS